MIHLDSYHGGFWNWKIGVTRHQLNFFSVFVLKSSTSQASRFFSPVTNPEIIFAISSKVKRQVEVVGIGKEPAPPGDFEQRDAFLGRAAADREGVLSVGFGKTPVSFGQIRGIVRIFLVMVPPSH